jgi:hypothetical protein
MDPGYVSGSLIVFQMKDWAWTWQRMCSNLRINGLVFSGIHRII